MAIPGSRCCALTDNVLIDAGMARRQPWGIAAVIVLVPAAAFTAEPGPSASSAASGSSIPLAPPPDSVERAPEQVVWLRSGGVVRGQLVEYQPRERIVLQLATGEIRTISWSEVSRASFISPSALATPGSAATTSAARPARSADKTPDAVRIAIHPANPGLRLESKSRFDVTEGWKTECTAPCEKRIQVEERTFRIAGAGLRPSNAFLVNADGKTAKLSVREGAEQTHSWGLGLLISGAVLGLASGALYGAGHIEDSDPAVIGGLIGLGLGAAAVVGAVPLLARGRTTVRSGSGKLVASEATRWPAF